MSFSGHGGWNAKDTRCPGEPDEKHQGSIASAMGMWVERADGRVELFARAEHGCEVRAAGSRSGAVVAATRRNDGRGPGTPGVPCLNGHYLFLSVS